MRFYLIPAALVAAAGCASDAKPERPPAHPTAGRVLVNGAPAAGARVTLYPADPAAAARPSGEVGADGGFRLSTYQTGDGAPAGDYAVAVVWPAPPKPGADDEGPDRLNGRFAAPDRPAAKVTVRPGTNELDPIRLK